MRRVIVPALVAFAMVASSSANASAFGLFDKLCGHSCDSCCDVEPTCGCEPTCAAACEPACGCEVVDPCCDSGCCGGKKMGGLLGRLFHKHNRGCDSCCEPACGCEPTCAAPCEPTCAAPCEPACGCEVVDPCCDPCGKHHGLLKGLFGKIFHKHNHGCDSCCEPACGCEPTCAAPCEPTCGCEPSCCN